MRSKVSQGGFTLVEVIVVIVILGILAAFAVPRFAAIEVEARSAATTTLGGDIQASAARAHALWLAQGRPGAVAMESASIAMTNGYPSESMIDDVVANLEGFAYDDTISPVVFSRTDDGKRRIANCDVTYSAPAVRGAAPTVAIETSGC